ncbi:MAG: DUF4294 domain-containing protein [Bacteroidales bacterium]|nr:DUF4294 domain-containing protein [Bacteroidales bacterium]
MKLLCLAATAGGLCHAQDRTGQSGRTDSGKERQEQNVTPQQHRRQLMQFTVEDNDTIYIGSLPAAKVYDRLPRQKGREWRKYYRLVHNFSKVYPYALVARKLVEKADSTISADGLRRAKRDRYINDVQKELFTVFEKPLRSLTVTQGALLMKLIDRECGKSSYLIIKDYKNGMAAGFWQGIARMFGTDLKAPYDPEGDDRATEELVKLWDEGEFEGLYYSLFWEYPKLPEIPEEYR